MCVTNKEPGMKFAHISSDVSGQEPDSQKCLQRYKSDKSSPPEKSTSTMVDFCEGEAWLSPHCKETNDHSVSTFQYKDSCMQQSFPEKLVDSKEEAPIQTHCKKTNAPSASAVKYKDSHIHRSSPDMKREEEAFLQTHCKKTDTHYASTVQHKDSRIRRGFPEKLMAMLSHEEFSDSIRWLPHGRNFQILNPDKFNSKVLPLFFKHCKHTSFTRKLYRWGFGYISKSPDANSFFNENFSRDSNLNIFKIHCRYSQKELQARDKKTVQFAPHNECLSVSSSKSSNYPGSPSQSPSKSNLKPPSMQDSSSLHNVSASDFSNLSTSAAPMNSTRSTNYTLPHPNLLPVCSSFPLLSNLPTGPQYILQPRITSQCGSLNPMLSAIVANSNLQQKHALLQLAEMKVQVSKARLIAGLKSAISATNASDIKATLKFHLDQLQETQQPHSSE